MSVSTEMLKTAQFHKIASWTFDHLLLQRLTLTFNLEIRIANSYIWQIIGVHSNNILMLPQSLHGFVSVLTYIPVS